MDSNFNNVNNKQKLWELHDVKINNCMKNSGNDFGMKKVSKECIETVKNIHNCIESCNQNDDCYQKCNFYIICKNNK